MLLAGRHNGLGTVAHRSPSRQAYVGLPSIAHERSVAPCDALPAHPPAPARRLHRDSAHAQARRGRWVATGATLVTPAATAGSLAGVDTAVVWFKNDLRVDDHPGLQIASSAKQLCCLYVLDPVLLRPLLTTPAGPELLVSTLAALRSQLRSLGNDLLIRVGDSSAALHPLLDSFQGPTAVVAEAEAPASSWALSMEAAVALRDGSTPQLVPWYASAWHDGPFELNYRQWQAVRGAPAQPLGAAPARLPPAPTGLAPGDIPSPQQLRQMISERVSAAIATVTLSLTVSSVDESDADNAPAAAAVAAAAAGLGSADGVPGSRAGPSSSSALQAQLLRRLASDPSLTPLDLLAAYLTVPATPPPSPAPAAGAPRLGQLLEAASSQSWTAQRLIGEAAGALEAPSAPGASFSALLGTLMELGALSRRRVLQLSTPSSSSSSSPQAALQGALIPERAAAARRAMEVSDFHHLLSERGLGASRPEDAPPRTRVMQWRWRGMRNEYYVCEPEGDTALPADAPAILLVHGFGAFGDHWRANIPALAAAGYRVFAPTLPGFGRSEKAAVPYSQDLWRDFLTDFTTQVVGQQVVVAGNSIGGFIAASMAADYPDLVSGLVLLNSAGPITPGFDEEEWRKACLKKAESTPPRFLVQALSRALFWYLEATIPQTLKWLYPTNPSRADSWLAKEIYRAACDLGSIEVFQAAFYLPPPRALNFLIQERFKGPTLVLQGALDPLNDARKRAADLAAACKGADLEVVLLNAGHCPHDEQPEQVNTELLAWINKRIVRKGQKALVGAVPA